jgi:hypothetical protein
MSLRTQLIAIVIAAFALLMILELVRRRRLRIGYTLIWLMVGVATMILILFPPIVSAVARLMGIASPRSLLFTAGIAFALWIALDHSLTLTKLWRQDKDIAQQHALLEKRVRQLQDKVDELTAARSLQPQLEWKEAPTRWLLVGHAMSDEADDEVHEPQ